MFAHDSIAASEVLGLICFFLALVHTFAATRLKSISHLLSETELAFPIWGVLFLISVAISGKLSWIDVSDPRNQIGALVSQLDAHEPIFVFVILLLTNTPWVLRLAAIGIDFLAGQLRKFSGLSKGEASYLASMILGPLLGSLITEPAAMTVTALFLRERFFKRSVSQRFKFMTFANLLVNVSIGGALTNFAAPPILMVKDAWGWSSKFMFLNFGWSAALAIVLNTTLSWWLLRTEFKEELTPALEAMPTREGSEVKASSRFLDHFEFRSSLFVALFLMGVVILGNQQAWWLRSVIEGRSPLSLFLGATALTSVTDNAALTYLSTQIHSLTETMKHAVVAGSIAGGGLTIVANAPNPIGFALMRETFGADGLGVGTLLRFAILPTLIAMTCLWGLSISL